MYERLLILNLSIDHAHILLMLWLAYNVVDFDPVCAPNNSFVLR